MSDTIALIALIISSILALIEIVKLAKYWKKPKIEIDIGLVMGKLSTENNVKLVELRLDLRVLNSGNQEVFIREVSINHDEILGGSSIKRLDTDFKLEAKDKKDWNGNIKFTYNPKQNKGISGEWDNIYVKVVYDKKKKVDETVYFNINENGGLSAFWGKDSFKKHKHGLK